MVLPALRQPVRDAQRRVALHPLPGTDRGKAVLTTAHENRPMHDWWPKPVAERGAGVYVLMLARLADESQPVNVFPSEVTHEVCGAQE